MGILIFDGVEVLDFAGPFEVFSVARSLEQHSDDFRLFVPLIVAEEQQTIRTAGNLFVEPHHTIANHPPLDLIVVPGGRGTRILQSHEPVLAWIRSQSEIVPLTTSVCTGSLLLAASGLHHGKSATTHWGAIQNMRDTYPDIDVRENVRFVDQGSIVTSAGVSAGIDMALAMVARLHGDEIARQTARTMEYDWHP